MSELNEPSFSNGAVYADLDNDGDQDIVVNNMDMESFLFRNTTSDTGKNNFLKIESKGALSESFAKITVEY